MKTITKNNVRCNALQRFTRITTKTGNSSWSLPSPQHHCNEWSIILSFFLLTVSLFHTNKFFKIFSLINCMHLTNHHENERDRGVAIQLNWKIPNGNVLNLFWFISIYFDKLYAKWHQICLWVFASAINELIFILKFSKMHVMMLEQNSFSERFGQ